MGVFIASLATETNSVSLVTTDRESFANTCYAPQDAGGAPGILVRGMGNVEEAALPALLLEIDGGMHGGGAGHRGA